MMTKSISASISTILAMTAAMLAGCAHDDATTRPADDQAETRLHLDPVTLPPDARQVTSRSGEYTVAYVSDPATIPNNELFSLRVWLIGDDGRPVSPSEYVVHIDADMPHHGHGMVNEPIVRRHDDGGYIVRDMLFHMPGYWELYVDVEHHGVIERSQFAITIE